MSGLLEEICNEKYTLVKNRKAEWPVSYLEQLAEKQTSPRGFLKALKKSLNSGSFGLISEIKKASPSGGIIRQNFNPEELATAYQGGGATCLSVLTDVPYFQGNDKHLQLARAAVDLPVIRKDFMIDPYQILESRAIGADCILIIMAALSDKKAKRLYSYAKEFGMDVLVEVHNEDEMQRALDLEPDLLGVNNRDLKTLEVDLRTTENLIPMVPRKAILVSESGLYKNTDLQRMSAAGANCFLVGEALLRQADVSIAVKELLGNNLHNHRLGV